MTFSFTCSRHATFDKLIYLNSRCRSSTNNIIISHSDNTTLTIKSKENPMTCLQHAYGHFLFQYHIELLVLQKRKFTMSSFGTFFSS
jgi:hypothetical protein